MFYARVLIICLTAIAVGVQVVSYIVHGKIRSNDQEVELSWVRGLLGAGLITTLFVHLCNTQHPAQAVWLGFVLASLGLVTRIWAQLTLWHNWSPGVVIRAEHKLVVSGPYRFLRHPMYAGNFLFGVAQILIAPGVLLALLWMFYTALLLVRALEEDVALDRKFGASFRSHMARGKIFPSLYLVLNQIGGHR